MPNCPKLPFKSGSNGNKRHHIHSDMHEIGMKDGAGYYAVVLMKIYDLSRVHCKVMNIGFTYNLKGVNRDACTDNE